ncbi:MAG: tyrosine-type recombinase/integrase [Chthoniobacter sp.]|nr:tyrosine-type recombinase/integrase [Chthoniobacter sp.]
MPSLSLTGAGRSGPALSDHLGPSAVGFDAAAIIYGQNAIAESTRRTYSAAQREFEAYCRGRDWKLQPITPQKIGNWFAHLGRTSQIASSTLDTYRSAISTLHRELTMGAQPNPASHQSVTIIIDGVKREWSAREAQRRLAKPQPIALTPQLLEILQPHLPQEEPTASLMWAAATLGTGAVCRPSEFLGHPQKRQETALRVDAITFFAKDGVTRLAADSRATPAHFTIRLGRTKTDQRALKAPKVVANPQAVSALWRWMSVRAAYCIDSPLLFADTAGQALAQAVLLRALGVALRSIGNTTDRITGKSFRRGGASALVAAGLSDSAVAAVGGWASVGMVQVYSDADSRAARLIANSRKMASRK